MHMMMKMMAKSLQMRAHKRHEWHGCKIRRSIQSLTRYFHNIQWNWLEIRTSLWARVNLTSCTRLSWHLIPWSAKWKKPQQWRNLRGDGTRLLTCPPFQMSGAKTRVSTKVTRTTTSTHKAMVPAPLLIESSKMETKNRLTWYPLERGLRIVSTKHREEIRQII